MSGNKKRKRAASATPWDDAPREALTPAQSMVAASHRSMYAFRHERFDGDAEFFNGYPRTGSVANDAPIGCQALYWTTF